MKNFTGDDNFVYVLGDLHGDYKFFEKSLKYIPAKSRLILTGDYADRGNEGYEIITILNDLLDKRSDITALEGNHELYDSTGNPESSPCDLPEEVKLKFGNWMKFFDSVFVLFVLKLYTSAIINNVLFVHGGINNNIRKIEDLENLSNKEDMLWSDPYNGRGIIPNIRGAGVNFGYDVTDRVLKALNVKILIRSHEPGKARTGVHKEHNNKVWTINSSSYYGKPFLLYLNTITLEYEEIYT